MRWKLLRRRLSVSAPRMIVRSHLPWPLRWAFAAVVFGFSAAIALWAFEFGKDIAGLDRDTQEEIAQLQRQVDGLMGELEQAKSIANTAESLLKAERAAQEQLAARVKEMETETRTLKDDLGFFERLLPVGSKEVVSLRGAHAELLDSHQLRYQLLLMQNQRNAPEFRGNYEIVLGGTMAGRPWSYEMPGGVQPLQFRQYRRVEGLIDLPPEAVVKTMQVRVMDAGGVRATQLVKL